MSGGGSKSESENRGGNQFQDSIWGDQGDALKDLWGNIGDQWQGGQDQRDRNQEMNQDLLDRGQQGQEDLLAGGSYGDAGDIRQQLERAMRGGGNTGRMYEDIVGGPGNTYMDPMVDAMKEGAMENRDMLQAGNAQGAADMGQGGGSRHAMENAMTNRAVNRDMINQETNMRGQGYGQDMDWKMRIAQQADQGNQGNQDRLMEMLRGSQGSKEAGMNWGRGLQDQGRGANQGGWDEMANWKNLIGDPTKLGSGSGWESGSSKGTSGEGGLW